MSEGTISFMAVAENVRARSRRCNAALRRISLAVLLSVALLAGCGDDDELSESERDRAVAGAMRAYERAAATGLDLDRGPCIAETLPGLRDWVVDIAHDPRTEIDDDPANQCRRYREGEASHFVELDPGGRLIRAE
jgi:hypothetical protein